jgi:hypothetical protein
MNSMGDSTGTIDNSIQDKHKDLLMKAIYRWKYLLDNARSELHAQEWLAAVDAYQEAYSQAELLIHIADCKNCAIKNYVRTLLEYGYSLCKTNQSTSLLHLIGLARQTLDCYATAALTCKLLTPVMSLVQANDYQQDVWINQLFAEDAQQQWAVH